MNEEIIWQGTSQPNKSSKQLGRFIILFLVLALFWFLNVKFIIGGPLIFVIPFNLVLIILCIALLYGFIYNLFFHSKTFGYEYIITKDKLRITNKGKIIKEELINNCNYASLIREKKSYGDLIFKSSKKENDIVFIGIKNPQEVLELVLKINNKLYITNDKITFSLKK